tara:strand:+ start:160 stop:366 length:207 start_codon:yes stop_codon:yes gene_type:complete
MAVQIRMMYRGGDGYREEVFGPYSWIEANRNVLYIPSDTGEQEFFAHLGEYWTTTDDREWTDYCIFAV